MGIPKMFRFLTDRYPLIMQRLDEDHVFDHFYLDMNGIIHQCTHPSDDEISIENIEEMFARIFDYTERLYRIVAPTTLMFLAIDGVAPRAKMNQQRSRRFRSAKDAERAMAEAIARGDELPEGKPFDSNCITPGTQFMYDLSVRFRSWIHEKMSTDPAWQQGCTVVFSGSEVPGEGEHKIMDYIRSWKASKSYRPEIRHCMYGLDADLLMLGLVAHAPHFTLLREKMVFGRGGRKIPQLRGTDKDAEEFELVEIAMLRDMLFLEFKRTESDDPLLRPGRKSRRTPSKFEKKALMATLGSDASESSAEDEEVPKPKSNFRYSARRIVDDFVFMCILVGNDFIPHLPHLDIAEGAINLMFRIYKHLLPSWGGYLTDRHRLHPDRLESFLKKIAQSETHYFEHRAYTDDIPEFKTPEYRRKYYQLKFNFDVEGSEGAKNLRRLRRIYMEGLHWVLQYYHNGVSSWNWFYPDFYGALACDMEDLRSVKVSFQKGHPFQPLTQLMAVLPPESASLLPEPMRDLMVNPASPVVDFYPVDFVTDPNGKKQPWEAVVVVPFIDEKRLLHEVGLIDKEKNLTDEENKRDEMGPEYWFYAKDYPRSKEEIIPVRPSKYFIPSSARGRSSTSRDSVFGFEGSRSRSRGASPPPKSSKARAVRRQSVSGRDGIRGTKETSTSSTDGSSTSVSKRSGAARGRTRKAVSPDGDGTNRTKTRTNSTRSTSETPSARGTAARGRGRGRGVTRGRKNVTPSNDASGKES